MEGSREFTEIHRLSSASGPRPVAWHLTRIAINAYEIGGTASSRTRPKCVRYPMAIELAVGRWIGSSARIITTIGPSNIAFKNVANRRLSRVAANPDPKQTLQQERRQNNAPDAFTNNE